MARTVDPKRHAARRLVIIDAGLNLFAATGFDRTTTAAICREAKIGSGTFFHYFPTKQSLLLAILDLGTQETTDWFAAQEGRTDARQVLTDYVEHVAAELTDPRVPGFIRAVGALMGEPAVVSALAHDDEATRAGLQPWVARAQKFGALRTDMPATRLTTWLLAVLDGYASQLATAPDFDATTERKNLIDAVTRISRP